jgi:predicted secreted protein
MLAVFSLLVAGVANVAFAASLLTINLSSEAIHPAANDLMQATVSAEAAGATLAELSKQINQSIAEALKLVKAYPSIKVQSSGTNTYPVYAAKDNIESWRMRSNISLESDDTASLSELLGKLQTSLAVSSLRMLPSPETKRKAEDAAILDALTLFKERAKLLADAQGKNFTIKELSVNTGSRFPPAPPMMMRNDAIMSSKAAPMPIESGESMIYAAVSGKIEIE